MKVKVDSGCRGIGIIWLMMAVFKKVVWARR